MLLIYENEWSLPWVQQLMLVWSQNMKRGMENWFFDILMSTIGKNFLLCKPIVNSR